MINKKKFCVFFVIIELYMNINNNKNIEMNKYQRIK